MNISIKGSFLIILMAFFLVSPSEGLAQSSDEPQNQDEHLGLVFDPMAGGIIEDGYLFPVGTINDPPGIPLTDTFPGPGHIYTYTIPYSTTHPTQTWTPPAASQNLQTETYVERKIREIRELEQEMTSETDPERKATLKDQLDKIISMINEYGSDELKTALENRNQITPSGPPITYTQVPMYTQTLGAPPPTWIPPEAEGSFDFSDNPIPADFFGQGSEPFSGSVDLQTGSLDTVVKRSDPSLSGGDQTTVPVEIVELNLSSVDPITVVINGEEQQWDVNVDLDGGSGVVITQTLGSTTTRYRYDTNGRIIEEDQTTTRGGVTTRTRTERTQNYLDKRVQQIIDLEERAKTITNAGERTRLENQANGLRTMINDFGSQELRNSLQQATAANAPTPSINN